MRLCCRRRFSASGIVAGATAAIAAGPGEKVALAASHIRAVAHRALGLADDEEQDEVNGQEKKGGQHEGNKQVAGVKEVQYRGLEADDEEKDKRSLASNLQAADGLYGHV